MNKYVKVSCTNCKIELTKPSTSTQYIKQTSKGDILLKNFFLNRIIYTGKTETIDFILLEKIKCAGCAKKIGQLIQSVPDQSINMLDYIKLSSSKLTM
jgi:hypothetical protein